MDVVPDEGQVSPRWRRVLFAVISLGVTVGIMGYLLSKHSPRKLLAIALDMDRRGVLCFVLLSFAQVFFRTWRYQLLLRSTGQYISNTAMVLTTLIRNFFSDLLPARIGSLSYIWVVTQRLGIPLDSATSSFALSFLFDLVVMTPMVLGALLIVGRNAGLPMAAMSAAAIVLTLIAVGVLIALPGLLHFAGHLLMRFKGRAVHHTGERITHAGDQVRETKGAGLYGRLIALSATVRVCKYGAIYFLLYAILKPYGYKLSRLPVSKAFLGMCAGELAASTPVSGVAGFGAYEGAWAAAFKILGFPGELAEVTGVVNHTLTQVWGYGLGALALIVILLPIFGRHRRSETVRVGPERAESGVKFAVKLSGGFLIIALAVTGIIESKNIDNDDPAAAETASAEEEEARNRIATELDGVVVFDSNRSGSFGIWAMNPDSSGLRAIADSDAVEMYPSASPDGEWISYARYKRFGKRAPSEIWVCRIDGRDQRKVADDGTFPSWSADGTTIYFERYRSKLMAVDVENGEVEEILPEKAPVTGKYELVKPRVSSDGRLAAFISDRKGRWNVWVADLRTGDTRHVAKGCEPAWIPGTESLIWIGRGAPDTAVRRFDVPSGKRSEVVDADSGRSKEYFPSVSPDGKYVFYSATHRNDGGGHLEGNYQIYVKPLDGRDPVRLTFDEHTNRWAIFVKVEEPD